MRTACQILALVTAVGAACRVDAPVPDDADGDGYAADLDCDDDDPSVHPGAEEVCNDGADNGCDGVDGGCRLNGDVVPDSLLDTDPQVRLFAFQSPTAEEGATLVLTNPYAEDGRVGLFSLVGGHLSPAGSIDGTSAFQELGSSVTGASGSLLVGARGSQRVALFDQTAGAAPATADGATAWFSGSLIGRPHGAAMSKSADLVAIGDVAAGDEGSWSGRVAVFRAPLAGGQSVSDAPLAFNGPGPGAMVGATVAFSDGSDGVSLVVGGAEREGYGAYVFMASASLTGELSVADVTTVDMPDSIGLLSIAAGDLDGDAIDDAVAADVGGSVFAVLSDGDGESVTLVASDSLLDDQLSVADFDGDGVDDLVFKPGPQPELALVYGPITTPVAEVDLRMLPPTSDSGWDIADSDLVDGDGDGKADLLALLWFSGATTVGVLPGEGL